jgi:hypothetical protein
MNGQTCTTKIVEHLYFWHGRSMSGRRRRRTTCIMAWHRWRWRWDPADASGKAALLHHPATSVPPKISRQIACALFLYPQAAAGFERERRRPLPGLPAVLDQSRRREPRFSIRLAVVVAVAVAVGAGAPILGATVRVRARKWRPTLRGGLEG